MGKPNGVLQSMTSGLTKALRTVKLIGDDKPQGLPWRHKVQSPSCPFRNCPHFVCYKVIGLFASRRLHRTTVMFGPLEYSYHPILTWQDCLELSVKDHLPGAICKSTFTFAWKSDFEAWSSIWSRVNGELNLNWFKSNFEPGLWNQVFKWNQKW